MLNTNWKWFVPVFLALHPQLTMRLHKLQWSAKLRRKNQRDREYRLNSIHIFYHSIRNPFEWRDFLW